MKSNNISGKDICETGKSIATYVAPVVSTIMTTNTTGNPNTGVMSGINTYNTLQNVDCDKLGSAIDAYIEVNSIGEAQEWGYDN